LEGPVAAWDELLSRLTMALFEAYGHPERIIVPDRGTEAVVELEPGLAVAAVGARGSHPHFHAHSTERYKVIEGRVLVFSGGRGFVVKPGTALDVMPVILAGSIHHMRAADDGVALVEVESKPAWAAVDHFWV
jgi:mannose-6-phosphate isomerase-like protein (cupin superfamily)